MQTSEEFELLWTLKIAPSALICAWRVSVDRLPTSSNLALRGMQLSNLSCPLCQQYAETGHHLFVMCKVAQCIWDQCERWIRSVIFVILKFCYF